MLPEVKIKRKENIEKMKINNFLPAFLEKYAKSRERGGYEISEIYKEAVGADIASKTSVIKFEAGKLTIKTADSSLKTELKFMEEEIKNSINLRKSSNPLVDKIIFR